MSTHFSFFSRGFRVTTGLVFALALILSATVSRAQQTAPASQADPGSDATMIEAPFQVKELSVNGRVDEVQVRRAKGPTDYYDAGTALDADTGQELGARPTLRMWQFGGKTRSE